MLSILKKVLPVRLKDYLKNRLNNSFVEGVAIVLIYHRVVNLEFDPQLLAVSPDNFEKQLIYLKKNYNVISLQTLIANIKEKKIQKNSIVITFDDGYADNFHYALPIIDKLQVPATFFITAGKLDSNQEFWWDELEKIFYYPYTEFKALSLIIDGKEYDWEIRNADDLLTVYEQIHPLIKYITHEQRVKAMACLYEWAGISRDARKDYKVLSSSELKKMDNSDMVEIASHGINHPVLALEPEISLTKEAFESKHMLEDILKHEVNGFSYPFGNTRDYTERVINELKKAKYIYGIANIQGYTTNKTDEFNVPRLLVRNWNAEELTNNINFEKIFASVKKTIIK